MMMTHYSWLLLFVAFDQPQRTRCLLCDFVSLWFNSFSFMPQGGVEPPVARFLRPPRLPFRHCGLVT